VPAISKVTATYKEDIEVSDLDLADTIMDKEPTYTGPVPLNPAVIEPHGIDLPTVIFQMPKKPLISPNMTVTLGHISNISLSRDSPKQYHCMP
jgi:hypothetical protein